MVLECWSREEWKLDHDRFNCSGIWLRKKLLFRLISFRWWSIQVDNSGELVKRRVRGSSRVESCAAYEEISFRNRHSIESHELLTLCRRRETLHSFYQRQTFLATEFLWRFKKSFLSDWQKKAELSPLSLHRLFRTEKRMRVKTFALANLSSSFGLNRFWFPLFVNSNAAHLKNIVSALKGFLIVTITFGSLNRRRSQQVNKSFSFEVISIIQRNCTCHQQQESRRRFIRFKP